MRLGPEAANVGGRKHEGSEHRQADSGRDKEKARPGGAPARPRQGLLELELPGLFGDMSPRPRM